MVRELHRFSGVEELFVFILRFEDRAATQCAFGLVSDDRDVASCVVEPEELRIRFVATKEIGVLLVERLYERTRLTWCTRHGLTVELEAG